MTPTGIWVFTPYGKGEVRRPLLKSLSVCFVLCCSSHQSSHARLRTLPGPPLLLFDPSHL